jgi:hypothetical protein
VVFAVAQQISPRLDRFTVAVGQRGEFLTDGRIAIG